MYFVTVTFTYRVRNTFIALLRYFCILFLLYFFYYIFIFFRWHVCSRPVDDDDYDEQLADGDVIDDVTDDVSTGRLMTCTGLVEMPRNVPPGEI